MPIKTILVPVLNETEGEVALSAAIDLARQFSAHIVAAHVTPDPVIMIPQLMAPFPGTVMTDTLTEIAKAASERTAELKNFVSATLAKSGLRPDDQGNTASQVSVEWKAVKGLVPDEYATLARTADLTILTHPTGEVYDDNNLLEEVLLGSGHPVLLVPKDATLAALRPVLVGWNGSVESSRAVAAALPIIAMTGEAHVVTVGDPGISGPALSDVQAYLSRHDIHSEVHKLEGNSSDAADTLVSFAGEIDAGILVVGAYSHSRWRERVFGGTTRRLIEDCPVPVMLVH